MPYVNAEVLVELNDFDNEDLIEELEDRGFVVYDQSGKNQINEIDNGMEDVIWRYTRGYIEDAMILLERLYPELYGLHKRIK